MHVQKICAKAQGGDMQQAHCSSVFIAKCMPMCGRWKVCLYVGTMQDGVNLI